MEEKYIVVKESAHNHRNNVDVLDNTCSVCNTWADAYNEAMMFIYNGARKAEVYKLEASFEVENVSLTKGGDKQEVPLVEK